MGVGSGGTNKRKVIAYRDGIAHRVYPSITDAYMSVGVCTSDIVKCCRGKRKSAGGFTWEYIRDEETMEMKNSRKI